MLDIYAASEEPIPGITAQVLADRVRGAGVSRVAYAPTMAEAVARTVAEAKAGDAVLTLGAGNVSQAAGLLLAALGDAAA
jgi:UDP-N-acetylmuramate--alanine ligase